MSVMSRPGGDILYRRRSLVGFAFGMRGVVEREKHVESELCISLLVVHRPDAAPCDSRHKHAAGVSVETDWSRVSAVARDRFKFFIPHSALLDTCASLSCAYPDTCT